MANGVMAFKSQPSIDLMQQPIAYAGLQRGLAFARCWRTLLKHNPASSEVY